MKPITEDERDTLAKIYNYMTEGRQHMAMLRLRSHVDDGLTIIKERDATITKLREALTQIAALKPENMACDYWSHNDGLKPDDVFDLCASALAASPKSAANELGPTGCPMQDAASEDLAQLRAEQMQYSVLRNTLAASLEIGAPERTRTGDNVLTDAVVELLADKARIDACVPPNRGLAIVYADGNAIPCVCRTRDDIDAARAAK